MIFELKTESDWQDLVKVVAPALGPGIWVDLVGGLGSGKTTFVRCLLRYWGYEEEVPSPTYPLVLEYAFEDLQVIHLDAYRLGDRDARDWDLETWRKGLLLAEWSSNAWLRPDQFQYRLSIEVENERRRVHWQMTDENK